MMLSCRILVVGTALLAAPTASLQSQAVERTSARKATVMPARPSQGQLIRISLPPRVDGRDVASATFAGERLHVDEADRARPVLAAIPVDAPDSLPLVVRFADAAPSDSTVQWIRVRRTVWPTERLSVAPRYGSKPDSALEARTNDESRRAYDVSRRSHDTPRLWTPGFVRPRPGRVTSGFGKAREYNGQLTGRHLGTDFAGAPGAPVKATNRGIVALVDTFYYGGGVVYLDHGAGLVSAYMHLSRADVSVGDTVTKGQVIGRVGATGRVTGPHLHWVVRYGTITVDPLSLPSLQPQAAPAPPRAPGGAPPRKP